MNTGSILLVSSALEQRKLLSAALGACRARVLEAAHGDALDALLEREPLALCVVIEQMREDPVLDWAIGALERRPQLQLVVVFDSDVIDARRTLLEADPRTLVLSKPLDAARLASYVLAMLASDPERPASAMAPDELANERVLELQREFSRELPERLQKLNALLHEVRDSPAAAAEAATLAHRLRGSAGAYGFTALGQAAGELEELLNKRASAPLSRGDFARIELALSDMSASANSAPRSLLSEDATRSYLGLAPLLVLDDDAEFVRRVRFAARGQFLDSIVARHPRAALAYARRTPPIAVLVGARFEREFPGLCAKLRKVSGAARLPVVLAAPAAELDVQSLLGDLPAALVVSRASDDAELREVLRRLAFTRDTLRQRVLLLGTDQGYLRLLQDVLAARDVELRLVAHAERVLEALREYAPDLLLLDLSASDAALDVCRLLRRSVRYQQLPIVVVGEVEAAATRSAVYRAGASDFVSKQLSSEELGARLGARLEAAGLLEAQAEKDSLTGLSNLRPFLEAGERALARARRMIDPVSVVLLDIDALNVINADHGHVAGDDAIAQLGRLLRERFRASDLRCRWAGGQFALLFDGAGKLDILAAMKRLLEDFAGCSFQADRGAVFRATLSAGMAAFPEDGESLQALLIGADQRLCRAKQRGGGRLCGAEAP